MSPCIALGPSDYVVLLGRFREGTLEEARVVKRGVWRLMGVGRSRIGRRRRRDLRPGRSSCRRTRTRRPVKDVVAGGPGDLAWALVLT